MGNGKIIMIRGVYYLSPCTNDSTIYGQATFYHRNGRKSQICNYNDAGEHDGVWLYYNDEGVLYLKEEYKNGTIVALESFGSDNVAIEKYGDLTGTFPFKIYYPTGELKQKGSFQDGKMHGQFLRYWRNGNLKQEETYDMNKQVGVQKSYYINGHIMSEEDYGQGESYHSYKSYYVHGSVESEGLLYNGNKEYIWSFYKPNGDLDQQANYVEGRLQGWFVEYADSVHVSSKVKYEQGKACKRLSFNEQGEVYQVLDFLKGDDYALFTEDSVIIFSGNYVNASFEDTLKWYYSDGTFDAYAEIENDAREGNYLSYSRLGNLDKQGKYSHGKRCGEWNNYYKGGALQSKFYYVDGDLDSTETYYSATGEVTLQRYYKSGVQSGPQSFYNENGEPLLRINYLDDEMVSYQSPEGKEWGEPVKIVDGNEHIETYFPNGKVAMTVSLKGFLFDGELLSYYSNGQVFQKNNISLWFEASRFLGVPQRW